MTKSQVAKFSSYNRIVAFLLFYNLLFVGITRLLLSITQFKDAFAALKLLLPTSTTNKSSPATIAKNKEFLAMIDTIVSLANRAYLYAFDTDNTTLLSTFKVEISYFKLLTEAEQILLAQNILLALNTNSVALIAGYDITAAELTALGLVITAAQDQIAAPSTIIGNNKTATSEIDAAFLLVDEKVTLLEKSILGRFKIGAFANSALTSNFENAKKLHESVKHTALITTFTNILGEVIEGALAEITFDTETKSAVSNISGIAEIEQFVGGTYNVTYSAPGYITQVVPTKFTLGETTTTAIVLLKLV